MCNANLESISDIVNVKCKRKDKVVSLNAKVILETSRAYYADLAFQKNTAQFQ